MDLGIAGETALLISSTRGLGFGCAAALVTEGVRVVINGRNTERGIDAISRLGEKAHFVRADVSQAEERARLFEETRAHLGTISILVTNVDGPPPGPFDTALLRRFAPHAVGRADLSPEEAVQLYAERGPMKRLGTIEEFGALCAFLCSRQAGYITGQSIVIDGGHLPSLL